MALLEEKPLLVRNVRIQTSRRMTRWKGETEPFNVEIEAEPVESSSSHSDPLSSTQPPPSSPRSKANSSSHLLPVKSKSNPEMGTWGPGGPFASQRELEEKEDELFIDSTSTLNASRPPLLMIDEDSTPSRKDEDEEALKLSEELNPDDRLSQLLHLLGATQREEATETAVKISKEEGKSLDWESLDMPSSCSSPENCECHCPKHSPLTLSDSLRSRIIHYLMPGTD